MFLILFFLVKNCLFCENNNYFCYSETSKYYVFKRYCHYFIFYKKNNLEFTIGKYYYLDCNFKFIQNKNNFFWNKYYGYLTIYNYKEKVNFFYKLIFFIKEKILNSNISNFSKYLLLNNKNIYYENKLTSINLNYLLCLSAIHFYIFYKLFNLINRYILLIQINYRIIYFIFFILFFYLIILNFSIPYYRFVLFNFLLFLKKNNKYFKKKLSYFSNIEILFLAGSIILFFNYYDFYSIGFIVSFLFSFFIILINNYTREYKKIAKYIVFYFLVIILSFLTNFWLNGFQSLWIFITSLIMTIIVELIFFTGIISIIFAKLAIINIYLTSFFSNFINFFNSNNFVIKVNINIEIFFLLLLIFFILIFIFFKYKNRNNNWKNFKLWYLN